MFIDTKVKYSQSVEIRNFRYYVAGQTAADIEILCFADGKFAGQGEIYFSNNEKFATSRAFEDLNGALQNCYEIIERKIENNQWVKKTIKTLEKSQI